MVIHNLEFPWRGLLFFSGLFLAYWLFRLHLTISDAYRAFCAQQPK
jgi:hypothetical protein